jgi:Antibiotic biosynthesis monooxygenase
MFCRVTHVQAPEGRVEEGLKLWYDNVLPVTKSREGFKGALSLVDRDSGKALSITFWEGEHELLASTEADYHKRAIERFGEFFENAHEPENFELHLYTGDIFSGTYSQDEAGERVARG